MNDLLRTKLHNSASSPASSGPASVAQAPNDAVPLTVSVEVGGAIAGLGRQSSYQALWRGELPTIDFGGRRKYVLVARLAERVGRPITTLDIERAEEIVRSRKYARRTP